MTENEIAAIVLDTCVHIHRELGPGLLETVYETILEHELTKRGLTVRRQVAIPVVWDGIKLEQGFRADLIVNDLVIIELKSLDCVPQVAFRILLTYLRLTEKKLGLLVNFAEERVADGFKRVVNRL